MNIVINHDLDTPIYRQIVEQIALQIIHKDLQPNELLPSIRTIALDLKISVITSKKAYEELEAMGLIYTVSKKGCFVSEIKHDEIIKGLHDLALDRLKKDIEFYKAMGLTLIDLIDLLKELQ
jgi:GntR family transcriptional regulator